MPEPSCKCKDNLTALLIERDKLKEESERLTDQNYGQSVRVMAAENETVSLRERVSVLEGALEKIKFRNHPGTTNHELAKEALSRTSEDDPFPKPDPNCPCCCTSEEV
jgi:predicted nuclease with TOPRIM domain